MIYYVIGGMVGTGVFGFLCGLFVFKIKSRWCKIHGLLKKCPACIAPIIYTNDGISVRQR